MRGLLRNHVERERSSFRGFDEFTSCLYVQVDIIAQLFRFEMPQARDADLVLLELLPKRFGVDLVPLQMVPQGGALINLHCPEDDF
jgi:hypothetical protein